MVQGVLFGYFEPILGLIFIGSGKSEDLMENAFIVVAFMAGIAFSAYGQEHSTLKAKYRLLILSVMQFSGAFIFGFT